MYVYVCMRVYTCVCIYVYAYGYTHTHTYKYISVGISESVGEEPGSRLKAGLPRRHLPRHPHFAHGLLQGCWLPS